MAKTETITIKPIKKERIKVRIVGDSPLIMHNWDEKAKREMYEAQQGTKPVKKKERKNPIRDFVESMYWIEGKPEIEASMTDEESEELYFEALRNAKFGFPVTCFKQAGNAAAYRQGWVKNQMGLRGAYFIEADTPSGLVEIHSDAPEMREDMVKIGMGTADIRNNIKERRL